jgi:hypothetical protein
MHIFSYGFGLEECRERDLAEEVARKSLAMDRRNAFATHALSELTKETCICYTVVHDCMYLFTDCAMI